MNPEMVDTSRFDKLHRDSMIEYNRIWIREALEPDVDDSLFLKAIRWLKFWAGVGRRPYN